MHRQRRVATRGCRRLALAMALSVVGHGLAGRVHAQEPFILRWVPLPAGITAQRATELEKAAKAILVPQTTNENGQAFLLGRETLGVYSRLREYNLIVEAVQQSAQLTETRTYELVREGLWEPAERVLLSQGVPYWSHEGTYVRVRGPVAALASAETKLLQSGYIRDPAVPVCERVQLYYVRKPAAVAAMLNAVVSQVTPAVKVGAAPADDTVPFLVLSGPIDQVYQLKRMVAELDQPLHEVTFDIWAVQVSGRDRNEVARRVEEVRKGFADIRAKCENHELEARSALAQKLAERHNVKGRASDYRQLGLAALVAVALTRYDCARDAAIERLRGQQKDGAKRPHRAAQRPSRHEASDWGAALEAYQENALGRADGGTDLEARRADLHRAQASLDEITQALRDRARREIVEPEMGKIERKVAPRRTSGLDCVTQTTVAGLSGCAIKLTGAAVSYVESTKLAKLDTTAAGTATSPGTADALAARLGALLGGSPTSLAMGSLGLAMAASQEAQTWEALNDGAQMELTPTVMLNGKAAEVNIKLTLTHNDPGTAVPAQATSWPLARVGKHEVSTVSYAESLVPLELSSLEIQTTQPRPPNVVPFLGQIPFIGSIFRLRRSPVTMYHESLLLILPTVSSIEPETTRQLRAAGLLK